MNLLCVSAMVVQNTSTGFFSLPRELRNQIYKEAATDDRQDRKQIYRERETNDGQDVFATFEIPWAFSDLLQNTKTRGFPADAPDKPPRITIPWSVEQARVACAPAIIEHPLAFTCQQALREYVEEYRLVTKKDPPIVVVYEHVVAETELTAALHVNAQLRLARIDEAVNPEASRQAPVDLISQSLAKTLPSQYRIRVHCRASVANHFGYLNHVAPDQTLSSLVAYAIEAEIWISYDGANKTDLFQYEQHRAVYTMARIVDFRPKLDKGHIERLQINWLGLHMFTMGIYAEQYGDGISRPKWVKPCADEVMARYHDKLGSLKGIGYERLWQYLQTQRKLQIDTSMSRAYDSDD